MKASAKVSFNEQLANDIKASSQTRGSANQPGEIDGVDNNVIIAAPEAILPLLIKFKQVRVVSRCFDHIISTNPKWGDPSEQNRRNIFVQQLSESQKTEFREIFEAVDSR